MPAIGEWLEQHWNAAEHAVAEHLPHHAASQTPAQEPVNLESPATEGTLMSLSADLHAFATRLETIGEEAVTKLEAVSANPATAEVFDVLHKITGLGLDPAIIGGVASGLKTLLAIYTPDPAPAAPVQPQQPAVPVGQ